ncbi:unnamed protein product [Symbiodinium necroappetens]|uniref:Uncharacterized protein n=1 Tax=Symbiodinium necroappetens TaxID=1628268 RepID=A0A813ACM5_9DINO|nr:unnamed protein product [Symbiodinium necroappetens]
MLAALLRPWASELLAVVLRYEVAVVAVVLSVTTHMLTSTTRVIPARMDEEIVESLPWDGLPEDLFTWTRAFFTGLLFRIQELNGRLESGSGPELDVEQVQRDFMDITKVLLAMVGCLFALLTPLIAATWWLLDHPALPQEHLNQVLTFMFGFLAPIERRLRPLLFVGLSVSAALGVTGGPADHDFLSREDGVSCAKRLLISLVLLNLVLSLILFVLVSAVSSLLRAL